jgi:hypothetical protein
LRHGSGDHGPHRELANRLFATATAILEDAIEVAAAGQLARLSSAQLKEHGHWLQAAAEAVAVIAEAATIAADPGLGSASIARTGWSLKELDFYRKASMDWL